MESPVPLASRDRQGALSREAIRLLRHDQLQSLLYSRFYCQGGRPAPSEGDSTGSEPEGSAPFVAALSAANMGTGSRESDWECSLVSGPVAALRKEGLILWVEAEAIGLTPDSEAEPGRAVTLCLPAERRTLSPGFFMAVGNRGFTGNDPGAILRFYLNLSPEGAVRFMREATARLNQADVPFRLKVRNDPARFDRCDPVVLYAPAGEYTKIALLLGPVCAELRPCLRPGTPAFTKALAPGVGLAEDPGGSESFGMHRCGLLAEGLIRAQEAGETSLKARLDVVESCFAEASISLDQPYLNPGSLDTFDVGPFQRGAIAVGGDEPEREELPDASALLTTAAAIGQRLAAEAVWHADRCTWLGPQLAVLKGGGAREATHIAVGPDLYNGDAGIGLFLAHLGAVTGDQAVRRTALGAVRQALAAADRVPSHHRIGLYAGWIGMALAGARAGAALGAEEPLAGAKALLARLSRESRTGPEFDLVWGNAGAVVGLLSLRHSFGDDALLDWAAEAGDRLVTTAVPGRYGCSWASGEIKSRWNLTGFSHGTAGAAHALLQLFRATGEDRYRKAAEEALQYERACFDPEQANWPDFRSGSGGAGRRRAPVRCATFWCHGAPGIALSRLTAWEILRDPACRSQAQIALDTTASALQRELSSGHGNFSLCHGLAGNAEILLQGRRVLGEDVPDARALALNAAAQGIRIHAAGRAWPCGVAAGETPGLMLGLAGIGLFYLRLYDPAVPSVLMVP